MKPRRVSWLQFIHRTKQPELPVVLLEDCGALIGLSFAFVGVVLAAVTGNPRWDAARLASPSAPCSWSSPACWRGR